MESRKAHYKMLKTVVNASEENASYGSVFFLQGTDTN